MSDLHIHHFGSRHGPVLLALHGLTDHGKVWEPFATRYLPDVHVVAPDLRGHGRSTHLPPWNLETLAADLAQLILTGSGPVTVVGHSLGGALALQIAHRYPGLLRSMILLDPAAGLDPVRAAAAAQDLTDRPPGFAGTADAWASKRDGDWGQVSTADVIQALAGHLAPTASGKVWWRVSVPAVVTLLSELSREFVLPPTGLPTALVTAAQADPPFVTPALRAALLAQLGPRLAIHDLSSGHMVYFDRPAETAAIIRSLL